MREVHAQGNMYLRGDGQLGIGRGGDDEVENGSVLHRHRYEYGHRTSIDSNGFIMVHLNQGSRVRVVELIWVQVVEGTLNHDLIHTIEGLDI